jgi:hypothetical protein
LSIMKVPEPANATVVLLSMNIGRAISDAICKRTGQSTSKVNPPLLAAANAAAAATLSSVSPSHAVHSWIDFLTIAGAVAVPEPPVEVLEPEEPVLGLVLPVVVLVAPGLGDELEVAPLDELGKAVESPELGLAAVAASGAEEEPSAPPQAVRAHASARTENDTTERTLHTLVSPGCRCFLRNCKIT